MTLPGQMELATVVDHEKTEAAEDLYPDAWRYFNGEGGYDYTDDEETAERWKKHAGIKYADWLTPLYAQEDTHKPLGVRLAKMLNQYDDQPSSQLWSEIQSLAREILK